MKKHLFIGLTISAIIALAVGGFSCQPEYTMAESEAIARTFLEESPTYQFSGVQDSIELTGAVTTTLPYRWEFTYQFISEQSGYGDRTGMDISPAMAPYEIKITVLNYKVTHATIDDRWNEIRQNFNNEPI